MSILILGMVLLFWAPTGCGTDDVPATPFADIRGANYLPSYAATSVVHWGQYEPEIIERELKYTAKLELNSLRVFLQYWVYADDREQFFANLDHFVRISEKHGISLMIVLFDSCFGITPSMESGEQWVSNPGPDHIGEEFWPALEEYVADVVTRYRGDSRVLIWDIMNEPHVTWQGQTEKGLEKIWNFVRHFCRFVKEQDPTHPITVGVGGADNSRVADLVDVLSLHSYAFTAEQLQKHIDDVKRQAAAVGKPYLISECGAPGWRSDYNMLMPVLRDNKIGYYFFEVMIGKDQFRTIAGLLYPDGTARKRDHIWAVMGPDYQEELFKEKPDWEGVPLNRFGGRYLDILSKTLAVKTFERFVRTPTTIENRSERYTFFKSVVTLHYMRLEVFGSFSELIDPAVKEIEELRVASTPQRIRKEIQVLDQLINRLDEQELPHAIRTEIADWYMRW